MKPFLFGPTHHQFISLRLHLICRKFEYYNTLFLVFVLALGLAAPVYAGNEITCTVDEFTGFEMVAFKKPLKFERTRCFSCNSVDYARSC